MIVAVFSMLFMEMTRKAAISTGSGAMALTRYIFCPHLRSGFSAVFRIWHNRIDSLIVHS